MLNEKPEPTVYRYNVSGEELSVSVPDISESVFKLKTSPTVNTVAVDAITDTRVYLELTDNPAIGGYMTRGLFEALFEKT